MLDFRHRTFLTLCQYKNYAKTAQFLHLTQPGVSQHMKYLEELYGTTLIAEKGKRFSLTSAGMELLLFIQACDNGLLELRKRMHVSNQNAQELIIGATRSIGECIMPALITKALEAHQDTAFHLQIDNTHLLLESLQKGKIHFAFVEGYFPDGVYEAIPFSREEFIGVCAPSCELAKQTSAYTKLLKYRQIVREKGSGSREIYEELLHENHMRLDQFPKLTEVNNLAAIKKLVMAGAGISFLYKFTVENDLKENNLCQIPLDSFSAFRKLHFVYPKNSLTGIDYPYWFQRFLYFYQ